ncbi:inositol 2-dehydrogenase [Candidatus Heimdallarchaeota archaeon]|nr:MAG: inositol 2-dehydrogenase [Deltaproteobacteria bacterium]RLI72529.1 MAG: inositol 2-dehydrogenase [Candidatus Heimdallarchaeota archaeon]
MSKVRVAVIGTGRIGKMHARNIKYFIPNAEVIAVADVAWETAKNCAEELGIPRAEKDYRRLLEEKNLDAVIICTSTDTHAQIIKDAASAKKHVFCEKPIALTLKEIDDVLQVVNSEKVKFQVGFQRRFDVNFQKAKECIQTGKIGDPHVLKITSRDSVPPPPEYVKGSGGIFLDMTIHDFDMARYLLEDEVEEVYAIGSVLVDPRIGRLGDVDTAVVTLRFRSGTLGVIDNSRQAVYGYDQRVEVLGSKGMLIVQNPTSDTTLLSNENGTLSSPLLHFFIERYTEAYINEIRAFIEAIIEDKDPPVTGEDGRIPVVIAYAAQKSLNENRPVKLSEIAA